MRTGQRMRGEGKGNEASAKCEAERSSAFILRTRGREIGGC
jgi:hypothetical protein